MVIASPKGDIMKNIVDNGLNKLFSRKLLVWLVGTVALFTGYVDADNWIALAIGYVGVQSVSDIVAQILKSKKE